MRIIYSFLRVLVSYSSPHHHPHTPHLSTFLTYTTYILHTSRNSLTLCHLQGNVSNVTKNKTLSSLTYHFSLFTSNFITSPISFSLSTADSLFFAKSSIATPPGTCRQDSADGRRQSGHGQDSPCCASHTAHHNGQSYHQPASPPR